MEKRAVIDEEITPTEEPRGKTEHAVIVDEKAELAPYIQKVADMLCRRRPAPKLEELDENHPTRRLIDGVPPIKK